MSKTWTFIGGVIAGNVGVFTAAGVALELNTRKGCNYGSMDEPQRLALPENKDR